MCAHIHETGLFTRITDNNPCHLVISHMTHDRRRISVVRDRARRIGQPFALAMTGGDLKVERINLASEISACKADTPSQPSSPPPPPPPSPPPPFVVRRPPLTSSDEASSEADDDVVDTSGPPPCRCTQNKRSNGVYVNMNGCFSFDQNNNNMDRKDGIRFCYVVSDDNCPGAVLPSTTYPGAGWRVCNPEDEGEVETNNDVDDENGCACTDSDRSGDIDVPRSGCDFPIPGVETSGSRFCYVKTPTACPEAIESRVVPGASWRLCDDNDE